MTEKPTGQKQKQNRERKNEGAKPSQPARPCCAAAAATQTNSTACLPAPACHPKRALHSRLFFMRRIGYTMYSGENHFQQKKKLTHRHIQTSRVIASSVEGVKDRCFFLAEIVNIIPISSSAYSLSFIAASIRTYPGTLCTPRFQASTTTLSRRGGRESPIAFTTRRRFSIPLPGGKPTTQAKPVLSLLRVRINHCARTQ